MDITIKINCDNDAFASGCGFEVGRILSELAVKMRGVPLRRMAPEFDSLKLFDTNGNSVGRVEVSE